MNLPELELDFGPAAPEPDYPATRGALVLNPATLALMHEAWALVPVPRVKRPYRVNRGSGWSNPDWRWRWGCPCCPFTAEETSKPNLEARIMHHRCRARESARWHPRYRMPPRYSR